MTTQQIHDALSQLPEDLIAEADVRRSAPPKVISFRRYAAMAACFAVVLACGVFTLNLLSRGGAKEAAAEVQMAGVVTDAEVPAAEYYAAAPVEENGRDLLEAAPEEAPAQNASQSMDSAVAAGSGSAQIAVYALATGETFLLPENNSVLLRLFLEEAIFDPYLVCNGLAEYRVEFSGDEVFEINLTEGFVRNGQGQYLLSELRVEELRAILQLPEVTP